MSAASPAEATRHPDTASWLPLIVVVHDVSGSEAAEPATAAGEPPASRSSA